MTSLLIFYDAFKLKEYNEEVYLKEIKLSPVALSIGSILLLVIFAPFYLVKRNSYFNTIKNDAETIKKNRRGCNI